MNARPERTDLVVLVADKDMEMTLQGLLSRHQALGIREINYTVYRHPGKDSGCRTVGVSFLRDFCRQFEHAVLVFDYQGSGGQSVSSDELELQLESDLRKNGWGNRASTVVIEPELEIWIWGNSSEVDQITGWAGRIPSLRDWLVDEGFLETKNSKPDRPKEAFRHALHHARKQPSSSLFKKLSERVSFRGCQDRAFTKLRQKLQEWYPQT